MKTKKQRELIDSFLAMLGAEDQPLYQELVLYLSELGYNPKKERSNIAFKHELHNKQIVKIGIRGKKESLPFSLYGFQPARIIHNDSRKWSVPRWSNFLKEFPTA